MKKFRLLLNKLVKHKFSRFTLFGAFCNILGIGSLYVFTDILKLNYIFSLIIALIYVNFIGFCLNKNYTFRTPKKLFFQELYKYYSVMFSGFILNISLMFFLVDIIGLWYIKAAIIVSVLLLFVNYILHNNWSFNHRKR